MRKLLLAGAALTAPMLGGFALAADMAAVPRYKAPPIVAYSWTGFYLGANAGVSAGVDPVVQTSFVNGFRNANNQSTHSPFGAIGGLQAGYSWQSGNGVVGIEADAQISGQKSDTSCLSFCASPNPQYDKVQRELPWFATVRGRLGYASGPVLFYGTAGVAFGQVKTSFDTTNLGAVFSGSDTSSRTGVAVGGGIEAALFGNWTAKIEYLYLDFGTVSSAYTYQQGFVGGTTVLTPISGHVRDHIARLGLNYRFGDPAPAEVARAMPTKAPVLLPVAYNWSGVYVGGNVGYSVGRDGVVNSSFGACVGGCREDDQMTMVTRGWLGGPQIGVSWQSGNWVAGLEADYQFSGQKDSAFFNNAAPGNYYTIDQKVTWFATGRGRLGYAAGPALFYATGGVAFAGIKTNAAIVNAITGATAGSFSNNRTGWVVGAGIEGVLAGNWTAKVEYLYMEFSNFTNLYPGAPALQNLGDPNVYLTSRVRDNVFRVGLNYHFDRPVVARY